MGFWFTEKQTDHFGITAEIKRTLDMRVTPYQKLAMVETAEWGNMLLLDDMVMTSEKDEFVYHEMISHVPLFTHPNPEYVLVVGGGDGGVVREVLKHKSVKKVVLVEIDDEVIVSSKKYLPSIAGMLDDPRVEVKVGDGFMHIAESKDLYDVILVDSTEPVGPAVQLFTKGFYVGISEALKEDGIFVAQSDNPWFKTDIITNVVRDVKAIFKTTKLYTANIPTYPSGLWTFTLGSKKYDPLQSQRKEVIETKYYTDKLHQACFVLPKFVEDLIL